MISLMDFRETPYNRALKSGCTLRFQFAGKAKQFAIAETQQRYRAAYTNNANKLGMSKRQCFVITVGTKLKLGVYII